MDSGSVDRSIDIDLIKDEQNPMYQNVDIQRQRLMSVLDRALEKISIAYVLEEMLTKNVSVLQNLMTEHELNTILNLYRYAKRLEQGPRNIRSSIIRGSVLSKLGLLSSKSIDTHVFHKPKMSIASISSGSEITSSVQLETEAFQEREKGGSPWEIIAYYYSSVISKLHFVPEINDLAKYMIYKKPVGSIKYYVYLKDLREYVFKLIYQTKTDEVNHEKTIKQAFVKNLKEKPQAQAVKKILHDKRKEKVKLEQQFKKDIEQEKLIQAEMNEELRCLANEMILTSERKIMSRRENHHHIQEENKVKFAECSTSYNKQLDQNILSVKVLRKKVQKLEVNLKKILDDYDSTIGELHADFEVINGGYLEVEAMYNDLKAKFDAQEEEYVVLMEEKKLYVEMASLRICYNRSARIIQRWWREKLKRIWRKRKTYLIAQLKNKSLPPEQRAKMRKILKQILLKQKKAKKKW